MSSPTKLLSAIATLLRSLQIPHMVVGSFASTFYGVPRTTQILDFVIDPTPEQVERLLDALDPDLYYVDRDVARDALRRRTMFNVIEIESGWKLDLVIRKSREFSITELARRESVTMLGVDVSIATAEDTIISKLEWAKASASTRQLEDVAGILRVRRDSLDMAYIEHWVSELKLESQWAIASTT